jgi:hypothetical protein
MRRFPGKNPTAVAAFTERSIMEERSEGLSRSWDVRRMPERP